jgi:hypothetical protein
VLYGREEGSGFKYGNPATDAEKNYFWHAIVIMSIMNVFRLTGLFVLFFLPGWASGQSAGIDAALQKGNAADLGVHFAKSLDLSLPGVEDTFTPDKAVSELTVFFSGVSVKGYKRVHHSAAQEGRVKYTIGDLYTAKGTYRITLYYDPQDKITEVRIVK